MLATRPVEVPVSHARRSFLRRDFKFFARAFARRYFEPIPFPEETARKLDRLHQEGEVVHVMRSVGVLNFLYLAWVLLRNNLPPLRACLGLRFSFWSPFRRLIRSGRPAQRLTRALDDDASALVFLREPSGLLAYLRQGNTDNPFLALIARARKATRPLYLVPDLFLWRARARNLRPSIRDLVFGNPEAPGKLLTAWSFMLNYRTAFFRVGEPIDLTAFVRQNASDSDVVLMRKVRGALFHHLARETRAIVGPPVKQPGRIIEETLRDRSLRNTLDQIAAKQKLPIETVRRRARRDLEHIANRYNAAVLAIFKHIVTFVVSRLYQGIELDEKDIERTLELKREAPLVFCPSHKSHLDYLLMGWIFGDRGIVPPMVAAGANLSFWPLGPFLRRSSAFFLRRTFKGDPVYTATFKGYVKKLVREGYSQEFFIEGTRSRTGKLLAPKTGFLSFEVEAILDGARNDLYFVPVAIDYDKLVEARSYTREVAGGEKKPESITSLLTAPKVLASAKSGHIYISFGEPISLKRFLAARAANVDAMTAEEERSAVLALAQRITFGIGRATTLTPVALLSAALLAHRRRGITAHEAGMRIHLLRESARKEGIRFAPVLEGAPSDPSSLGPINEVMRRLIEDKLVLAQVVGDDAIYTVPDEKRANLCLYKNNLVHLFATRSFAAFALLSLGGDAPDVAVRERFLFLMRLLKREFSFKTGLHDPEPLYHEARDALVGEGLIVRDGDWTRLSPTPHAREDLAFVRDLTRDLVESYRCVLAALPRAMAPIERKVMVAAALEQGKRDFLAGVLGCAEALSKPTIENAVALCMEQGVLAEVSEKKLELTAAYRDLSVVKALLVPIDGMLEIRPQEA